MGNASGRSSLSLQLSNNLKDLSERQVAVTMPNADLLQKAGKHIEWLELVLTGITYADRRTIAAQSRRIGVLERMVARRDEKMLNHEEEIKGMQDWQKETDKKASKLHKRELIKAARITQDQVHTIERKFIKDLQTGFQKGNALSQARWDGSHAVSPPSRSSGTAATDSRYDGGGWKQYIIT